MHDYGTVVETVDVPVYLADYGLVTRCLMEAIIYQQPSPRLVLTRSISMPNATDATVSYTLISGATLEEWSKNMAESDLMIWRPVPDQKSGLETSYWN